MTSNDFEKSPHLAEVQVSYKTKVKASDRKKVACSADSVNLFREVFNTGSMEHTEEFVILLLNKANHVLGWAKISQGGITGTVVDKRVILQIALGVNATSLILAHNHPSGNTKPSEQDIKLTKEMKQAATLLDIQVLDHCILTSESYFSFADEGLL